MISYRLYGKNLSVSLKKALNAICISANNQLKICEVVYFDVNIVDLKKIKYILRKINRKYEKLIKIFLVVLNCVKNH